MSTMIEKKKDYEWKVPRTSWGIFAIISAITTSLGMCETFFDGNYLVGIFIGIAIQILLIWMNKKIAKMYSELSTKMLRRLLIAMYMATVLWSAGFSFVYISNHVYSSVFMRDDQELLTEAYQNHIASLKKLAEEDFTQVLDMMIGEISQLQSGFTEDSETETTETMEFPDFDVLEQWFAQDAKMLQIICKGRDLEQGKPVGDTENLLVVMANKISEMEREKQDIEVKRNKVEGEINDAKENILNWSIEKYRIRAGTTQDKELGKLIAEENNKLKTLNTQNSQLRAEFDGLDNILPEVRHLESCILVYSQSLEGTISSKFAQILVFLGNEEPDIEGAERLANEIYAALSIRLEEGGDNTICAEKMREYLKLKQHLNELRDIRTVQKYCMDTAERKTILNTESMVCSYPSEEVKNQWRQMWNQEYMNMKASLLLLPSAKEKVVQKINKSILWMQRSLLTDLNNIERAVYYLTCPHSFLAWLAFLLSLFLDASPIIFMAVRRELKKKENIGAEREPAVVL